MTITNHNEKLKDVVQKPTANGGTNTTNSGLEATPVCADDDEATPEVTEGPYFTPNSPERTSLLQNGLEGTKLTITG